MARSPRYTPLTLEQYNLIKEFRAKHGRTWKSAMREEWFKASLSGPLHALRNSHGPSWLVLFNFNKTPVPTA